MLVPKKKKYQPHMANARKGKHHKSNIITVPAAGKKKHLGEYIT
jgi:hypothetical protein